MKKIKKSYMILMINSHHNLSSLLIIGSILCIFKFGIPSYYDYNFSMEIKKYDSPNYSIYIKYNHVSNLQLMHREPTAYDFFLHLIICLDERFL